MLRKQSLQREFKAEILQQEAMDIEDLVQLGREMRTCPYYGSRRVAPAADLIILPYQSLLSKSSQESLGLNLKSSVVIIDEAHNLADTLLSMHDAKITMSQVNCRFHLLSKCMCCLDELLAFVESMFLIDLCSLVGRCTQQHRELSRKIPESLGSCKP